MAADYSKACDHEETQSTAHGTYCTRCGTRVVTTSELGPVKLDYADALADAKQLNWRRIPLGLNLPMPPDKPWYAAWREMPWGATEPVWRVERVAVGGKAPALAIWWADDVLGLPPCND